MGIKTDLTNALLLAMKDKNEVLKNALRLALSSIKLAEVEKGAELDDISIYSILHKEIKTREETIAEAIKAEREEMIKPLNKEIDELKKFLPAEISDDELTDIIKNVISELNAESIKHMGKVMKIVIDRIQGHASNDQIGKKVRNLLSPD